MGTVVKLGDGKKPSAPGQKPGPGKSTAPVDEESRKTRLAAIGAGAAVLVALLAVFFFGPWRESGQRDIKPGPGTAVAGGGKLVRQDNDDEEDRQAAQQAAGQAGQQPAQPLGLSTPRPGE